MKRILNLVIPKGRMFDQLVRLLTEAGYGFKLPPDSYRPVCVDDTVSIKIMKPQNIARLIELGAHDVGFTGYDWIRETSAKVKELLDTGFDPVRIVAAVPRAGKPKLRNRKKPLIVVSEYERITKKFLEKARRPFIFVRSYGSTEVFPPEDADMVVDNTATGTTLRQNGLRIFKDLFRSSTRMIANPTALKDPWRGQQIERMRMLIQSVLLARDRVLLEMNVPAKRLNNVIKLLPAMKSPTVQALAGGAGYAVKVAVLRKEVSKLVPKLQERGATGILEYELKKVVL